MLVDDDPLNSVCLSICLSVCLTVCLFVCVCLSVSERIIMVSHPHEKRMAIRFDGSNPKECEDALATS